MAGDTKWLPYLRRNACATFRLFCFAYAGGFASIFRTWEAGLPSEIEICAVQLPGRQTRHAEQLASDLEPLINDLVAGLGPFLDKPYAVFGHSLGALIGYCLVRRLQVEQCLSAGHLFVSACRAPQFVCEHPSTRAMSDLEFTDYVRRLRGTPDAILDDPEAAKLVIPAVRADFALLESYVHQDLGKLACPISAFGGLQDDVVPPEQLDAWKDQTAARFEMRMYPEAHFFLDRRRAQILRAIAADLSEHLGSAKTDER